ncbi:MAG: periplasmic heavy metal sensor [Candidatus Latescibacterota bacterium]|nr:MAG: periplasmic heavy metal sensor [Candidatus Latescibacterota bacterium]
MKLKILVGILVFLIVLNLATIGTFLYIHFTQEPVAPVGRMSPGPGMDLPMEPNRHGPMHFHATHRKELRKLHREFRIETLDLTLRIRDLELEAFELLQQDPVPQARVDSLLEEISLAQLEVSRRAAEKLIEAKRILPPDQQEIFFNAILKARSRMHGRLGPGHYRGGKGFRRHGMGQRPDSL